MTSQSYMEEIDCASFFDQIDDLIEFPPVNDTSLDSDNCNEYINMWTNNFDEFQVSDSVFIGSRGDKNATAALSAELSVPYEDIVQLEWLSNFVEDSFSGGEMTINKENVSTQKETVIVSHQFDTSSPVSVLESSSSSSSSSSNSGSGKMIPLSPIQRGPQKARSKRPRPTTFNPRVMMELLSPLVFVPVSSSSESEKNFTSSCGPNMVAPEPVEKKKKKLKKPKIQFSQVEENDSHNDNRQVVRKCMHCEITKTPQWRSGPMGPKSLCNACGVRYKSGRLFPEYRPAASPTFVPTLHSNSHKKVVEMRTKFGPNETMAIVKTEPEPELIPNINPIADYF
ncbi:GATA transcription factor 8 [Rutidosis leptorrhynchoides]|uniref:GATA transcription factor 8 n=1 Tax=Rutidosis leptorrhynchoides TaxID=125765 RepID=UPI003A996D99